MVLLDYTDPNELAKFLLKAETPESVFLQQFNGITPMAVGVGICFTLTVQCFANHKTRNTLQKALLTGVAFFTLSDFTLMCVDRRHLSAHIDSFADQYYFDTICIILSFLITSICAYLSQIFFGLRVYALYNRNIKFVVPIIASAHISLFSGLALDIYALTQPHWDSRTHGEELRRVQHWLEKLLRVRRSLQAVWVMSTLVCDLLICTFIIIALFRLKTNTVLHSTKSTIGKLIIIIMETMFPPMVFALIYAIVILSRKAGPGSWFRNTAAFQSLSYWFAIVWVLRTQNRFIRANAMDNASRLVSTSPTGITGQSDDYKSGDVPLDESRYRLGRDDQEILTLDEALKSPELVYQIERDTKDRQAQDLV